MEQKESPAPLIETDEQCTYFLTVLPVHDAFDGIDYLSDQDDDQESNQESILKDDSVLVILQYCVESKSKLKILQRLGLTNQTANFKRHIEPLLKKGLIERTIPEKPKDRNQKYRTTEVGKRIIRR
jgi:ATP-dependent DNA helicase RecG